MPSKTQSPPTKEDSRLLHAQQTRFLNNGPTSSRPTKVGPALESARKRANTPESTASRIVIARAEQSRRRIMPEVPRLRSRIDPDLREVIRLMANGALNWPLTLVGDVGTGKTCAALCVCDGVPGSIYKTIPLMMDDIGAAGRRELWDEHTGDRISVARYWREWGSAPFVVIDEVGAREKVPDFYYETLLRAINDRHGKPLAILSNLELDQISNIIDDRVASRIASGTVFELRGEDRRIG